MAQIVGMVLQTRIYFQTQVYALNMDSFLCINHTSIKQLLKNIIVFYGPELLSSEIYYQ